MTRPDAPKIRLRRQLRDRRGALSRQEQDSAAHAAAKWLSQLPRWPQHQRIALYLPNDGELDTAPIARLCRAEGRELFLPRLEEGATMHFARWSEDDTLRPNRHGIPEPPASASCCRVEELQLVLIPLVGWDRAGHRLGMGGGYYDRALAVSGDALLVGLAHSIQEAEALPSDDWDVLMDYVLTEKGLILTEWGRRPAGSDDSPPPSA